MSSVIGVGGHICFFFFQAEDGIRDLVRSRGLGDVYKRQQVSDELGDGFAPGLFGNSLEYGPHVQRVDGWPASLSLIHI